MCSVPTKVPQSPPRLSLMISVLFYCQDTLSAFLERRPGPVTWEHSSCQADQQAPQAGRAPATHGGRIQTDEPWEYAFLAV